MSVLAGIIADLADLAAPIAATVAVVVADMSRREAARSTAEASKAALHAQRVDIAVNGRRAGSTTISDDVTALRDDMDDPATD